MISDDRLIDLDPDRLEILQRVFPAYGEAARPIDLFERDKPEIFAVPVKKDFGEWLVVGIFNYDENAATERQVDLKRLRLDPSRNYVAYDFWNQRLHRLIHGEIKVRMNPSSVALLVVHERRGVPQVISTDRHFSQGGIELRIVAWDGDSNTLQGTSLGPVGTSHNVAIYIPENYKWAEPLDSYYKELGEFSLKLMEPQLLRVHVRFEKSERTKWEITFKPQTLSGSG